MNLKKWSLLLGLAAGVIACGRNNAMTKLTIQKTNFPASTVILRVELADTDEERIRGLMFRKSLGAKEGMLFLFDQDNVSPFWMKNTYLPLDILFINSNHEIVDIKEGNPPLSEELIRPNAPYRLALEVNAGFAKEYKLEPGDRVVF
jgi:hypothetical protein